MNSIDIFLLASEWEGFGFVLVGAMVREVPVICFDITSNPEIIKDKETRFLVPFENTNDFADKILTLAKDPLFLKGMGKAGYQHVLKEFDLEEIVFWSFGLVFLMVSFVQNLKYEANYFFVCVFFKSYFNSST